MLTYYIMYNSILQVYNSFSRLSIATMTSYLLRNVQTNPIWISGMQA